MPSNLTRTSDDVWSTALQLSVLEGFIRLRSSSAANEKPGYCPVISSDPGGFQILEICADLSTRNFECLGEVIDSTAGGVLSDRTGKARILHCIVNVRLRRISAARSLLEMRHGSSSCLGTLGMPVPGENQYGVMLHSLPRILMSDFPLGKYETMASALSGSAVSHKKLGREEWCQWCSRVRSPGRLLQKSTLWLLDVSLQVSLYDVGAAGRQRRLQNTDPGRETEPREYCSWKLYTSAKARRRGVPESPGIRFPTFSGQSPSPGACVFWGRRALPSEMRLSDR
ncbi:hypothetical protein N657DRAFT_673710 [Parathielavia appendiculata]|uniref:Uncharacterized protein n=1 Tax=Parathielavia appendiculata TaxID=2587402 RepID=A0AAN6Z0V9_9PEZI|nr:hypothetical protein N657DRAFT_673710 [Parathielavia appendiculata]